MVHGLAFGLVTNSSAVTAAGDRHVGPPLK
jgi:hypothetical protein